MKQQLDIIFQPAERDEPMFASVAQLACVGLHLQFVLAWKRLKRRCKRSRESNKEPINDNTPRITDGYRRPFLNLTTTEFQTLWCSAGSRPTFPVLQILGVDEDHSICQQEGRKTNRRHHKFTRLPLQHQPLQVDVYLLRLFHFL